MASGTEVAKAYVQIIPSVRGISGKIKEQLGGEADAAGKSAGNSIVDAIKGVIGAAAIGTFVKESLNAGGAIQQSFGGLDTLYSEAAGKMKQYAQDAASYGVSANSYAEQATSFGAALKSAFSGDVGKAAESANMAIKDMADNSAKFGTELGSIQTAYQGFSKQNYTMLDNLKLGYGGTKSEMERLLSDAQKLTGVKYNIDNLGDVYEAIHVIQDELGVTGTAANEAGQTFTGSFEAMKAAAENMMAALSVGELDIGPQMKTLVETASNFVFNNLLPMLGNIAMNIPEAIGTAVETAAPILKEKVGTMLDGAFEFLEGDGIQRMTEEGLNLIQSMIDGALNATPEVIQIGLRLVSDVLNGISNSLPQILSAGAQMINSLAMGIISYAPQLIVQGAIALGNFINGLVNQIPTLFTYASQIIENIASGISANLPTIATQGMLIIQNVVANILNNLPAILTTGFNMIVALVKGVIQCLPTVAASAIELIVGFGSGIIQALPNLVEWGGNIVSSLLEGIVGWLGNVVEAGKEIIGSLIDGFKGESREFQGAAEVMYDVATGEIIYGDWYGTGTYTAGEVATGMKEGARQVMDAVNSMAEESNALMQSYDWSVGVTMPEDVASTILDGQGVVDSATQSLFDGASSVNVDFSEPAQLGVQTITDTFESGTTELTSTVTTMSQSAGDQFKAYNWAQPGQDATKNIVKGIKSNQNAIAAAMRACATSAKTAFNGVGWSSVGSAIIAGIRSGVSASSGSLYSQLRSVASNALASAKTELAINSPSKKFRDIIGKGMMEGWAGGVVQNEGMLLDAVAGAAYDSLGAAELDGFSTDYGRYSAGTGVERMVQLLEIIADKETTVIIGGREFRRTLEDQKVQFA